MSSQSWRRYSNPAPYRAESAHLESPQHLQLELMRIAQLLEREPEAAARAAAEILRAHPAHPTALLLHARAQRACGSPQQAAAQYAALAAAQPDSAMIRLELGCALRAAGRDTEALAALERAVVLAPDLAEGWRELSLLYSARGDALACDTAHARFEALAPEGARLEEAVAALATQRYAAAEELLQRTLARTPHDVVALRLLAKAMEARENYREAERLLRECLRLAPGYSRARLDLVRILHEQQKGEPMLPLIERLLAAEPRNESYRTMQAIAYSLIGDTERALAVLQPLVEEFPQSEVVWLNYGHALRTAGRGEEAIAAYRKCAALKPDFGSAWVALANLKTFRFTPLDVDTMQRELAGEQLPDDERSQFEFALGKALEDDRDYAAAFAHYSRGNALRRAVVSYRGEVLTRFVERTRALYTREFFAERAGSGCPAPDPIFVVGLPRAGSTLVEQILASHSQVEGTMELPEIPKLARELARGDKSETGAAFLRGLEGLPATGLRELGERYLTDTRVMRRSSAPRFIDKMPNNWVYVGLIHLILPNARIIDARRHPLGCCFSCFKQHFARGQSFTYGLEDLGRYYRDYVDLMAHFDRVLPGRVHRVFYERLVEDPEPEVRALLAHCGLAYEEGCLRFHENARAVRTASSEQVRQPLFREGIDHWKNFEPWLGPLEQALGPVLAAYPSVPSVF